MIALIADYLTDQGAMSPAPLDEQPFTDVSISGVEDVFADREIEISVLNEVRDPASA